jgi:hypothetical protein
MKNITLQFVIVYWYFKAFPVPMLTYSRCKSLWKKSISTIDSYLRESYYPAKGEEYLDHMSEHEHCMHICFLYYYR